MQPEGKSAPMDFMGHVPRKKKPTSAKSSGGTSLIDAAPPAVSSAGNLIPRKTKPMVLLKRAQELDRTIGNVSERSTSTSHDYQQFRAVPIASESVKVSNEVKRSRINGNATDNSRTSSNPRVRIISETPFLVKIKTKGVPQCSAGEWPSILDRSSVEDLESRSPNKRPRPSVTTYKELEDTDSDDFLTEAEEQSLFQKRMKKRRKKLEIVGSNADNKDATAGVADSVVLGLPVDSLAKNLCTVSLGEVLSAGSLSEGPSALLHADGPSALSLAEPGTAVLSTAVESPPPGVLPTLWYSRECFLHVLVMEKICGWKTRPKVYLVEDVEEQLKPENDVHTDAKPLASSLLNHAEAIMLQQKALMSSEARTDIKKRMEISRINATHCPIVLTLAATESQKRTLDATEKKKRYKLQFVNQLAGQLTGQVASFDACAGQDDGREGAYTDYSPCGNKVAPRTSVLLHFRVSSHFILRRRFAYSLTHSQRSCCASGEDGHICTVPGSAPRIFSDWILPRTTQLVTKFVGFTKTKRTCTVPSGNMS